MVKSTKRHVEVYRKSQHSKNDYLVVTTITEIMTPQSWGFRFTKERALRATIDLSPKNKVRF